MRSFLGAVTYSYFQLTMRFVAVLFYTFLCASVAAAGHQKWSPKSTWDRSRPRSRPILDPGQTFDARGNVCWNNLTALELYDAAQLVFFVTTANLIPFRKYVLCPNTVFDISSFNETSRIANSDGQQPIILSDNQLVQCGQDSKSSNNCTLRGGGNHLLGVFSDIRASNATFQGLTFEDSERIPIVFNGVINVRIIDCIFQVSNCLDLFLYRHTLSYLTLHGTPWLASRCN